MDIGYDGTDFSGWATQPGRRTVQGELEAALGTLLRQPVRLTVAGRTDAGVHATGQVAHADLPSTVDCPGLQRRLLRLLPADLAVGGVRPAPDGFDARFGALRRHYVYRIADVAGTAAPLWRRDTLIWPHPLEVAAMNEAARTLLGEHDFAAYCRRREGATTVRELQRLDWQRGSDGVLVGRVSADAFCHNMVRSLVGALLAVGEARRPVPWPAQVLATGVRCSAVAPAHGLTLVGVDYPPDELLAARAAATRAVRVVPSPTAG